MAVDKENNTQILLTLPKELLKEIEDFQFKKRIPNRSEAARQLIQLGIRAQ